MKDKLTKTGHKKGYYRFVSAMKGLGFSLLAAFALALPVFVSYEVSVAEARAEAESSHVVAVPQEETLPEVPETSSK